MQPYFFPYVGYFQLIAQSDLFVFHDDVQYLKGGWINRNRVLRNGGPCWITLPVRKAAHYLPINQRFYHLEPAVTGRVLRRIDAAYRKAPRFAAIYPLIEDIVKFTAPNVATFNVNLIEALAVHLGIRTRFVSSSALDKDDQLTGQERVIDICRRLGASWYLNPIGGTHLYQRDRFAEAGIELRFLQPTVPPYPQFGQTPVPDLSIIDALMFNNDKAIDALLRAFQLVEGELSEAP